MGETLQHFLKSWKWNIVLGLQDFVFKWKIVLAFQMQYCRGNSGLNTGAQKEFKMHYCIENFRWNIFFGLQINTILSEKFKIKLSESFKNRGFRDRILLITRSNSHIVMYNESVFMSQFDNKL